MAGKPREAQTPADGLEAHLGYWLRLVSNQVSGAFARALQGRGVSVAEWVALSRLATGEQDSPAALAEAMGMTRGAITKVLDKLAAKHWVTREVSSEDNRVQLLALTRQGRLALPPLAGIADANDAQFFAALSSAEQATLRKLLRKLASAHRITTAPVD